MLWCRDTLTDPSSIIQRIQTCCWLSDAWYLCPQCNHPERFSGCSTRNLSDWGTSMRTESSRLMRAVAFFKHSGRKSSVKEEHSSSAPYPELDGGSRRIPDLAEISNPILHRTLHEMARPTQIDCSAPLPEILSPFIRPELSMPNPSLDKQELPGDASRIELPCCLPASSANQRLFGPCHPQSLATLNTTLSQDSNPTSTVSVCRESCQTLAFNSTDNHSPGRQLIVKLRESFCTVKSEWERRLALPSIYSRWSTPALFGVGLKALKQWNQGTPPDALDEVFALMHLACACAYILHLDNYSYGWDRFFQDMFQWQHAVSERSDQLVFRRVVKELSFTQGQSASPLATSHLIDCIDDDLPGLLGNGRIVQECSEFLKSKIIGQRACKKLSDSLTSL